MERLDKIVSVGLNISRKDANDLIKHGKISVNDKTIKSPKEKFDENNDIFKNSDNEFKYKKFVYIMMNKPKGVISASDGKGDKSVVDILPNEMKRKGLFPAGRLDKDTTGFVLITDDGDFAHKILSPNNHIEKTYIATLDKEFDDKIIKEFNKGIELKDNKCMPAKLEYVGDNHRIGKVTISEGMYHQIKRMFLKFGIEVIELKRIKMGNLDLDEFLGEGQSRYLGNDELNLIRQIQK